MIASSPEQRRFDQIKRGATPARLLHRDLTFAPEPLVAAMDLRPHIAEDLQRLFERNRRVPICSDISAMCYVKLRKSGHGSCPLRFIDLLKAIFFEERRLGILVRSDPSQLQRLELRQKLLFVLNIRRAPGAVQPR